MTKVFAHRGFSGYYPENTMLAFEKVAELTRAHGIETDVQLSKDGELVIMHDEKLDRTTDTTGYVKDFTLAELKKVNVGVNMKGDFPRQTVPTVRELFAFLQTNALEINIELKTSVFEYEGIEAKLLKLAAEYGLEDRIFYSSFNHQTLQRIKALKPDAFCGCLSDAWIHNAGAYVESCGCQSLNPSTFFASKPENVAEVHAHGVQVMAWTPNTKEELRRLVENDVDVVITNFPDRALEVISEQ